MSNEQAALDAITDKVLAYRLENKEQSMRGLLKIHQQGPDLMADSRAVGRTMRRSERGAPVLLSLFQIPARVKSDTSRTIS